jgi:hypothetical protein
LLQKVIPQTYYSPDQLRFTELASFDSAPLRDTLLWIAAFLFLFDVAARKLDLRRLKPAMAHQPVDVSIPSALNQLKSVKIPRPEYQIPIETNINEPAVEQPQIVEQPSEPTSEYLERLKKAKRKN